VKYDPQVAEERRQLGLAAAMAVVTGESIALGIFLTPAAMAKALGSPLLLGLVWIGIAVMALCGALCYAELAIRFPESGGEFIYLQAGYDDRVAFLYGWMSSIVMYPGVAATLAVGSIPYFALWIPGHPAVPGMLPATVLVLFAALNLVGTRLGGAVMSVLNLLKFVILFSLVAWTAISGHAHMANLLPFTQRRAGSEPLFAAIAASVMAGFFSFGGWWEAGKIAGAVRNPRRTLPLAFLGGVLLVTVVYLVISAAFLLVLPIERMGSNTAFVAQFGAVLFGSAGARLLSFCVLLCVAGGIAALTMAAPRVCFAMARSGAFFPVFGRVHSRFGTPANAILLQTALALIVLFFGAFDRMLAYIIFSAVLFLALTASTLFRMRPRVRAWWYPAAPILFIALCAVIDLLILAHDPVPALIGAVIVLAGLPLRRILQTPAEMVVPASSEER
jgi:basic amino acid/polyamine antiporter, APA family